MLGHRHAHGMLLECRDPCSAEFRKFVVFEKGKPKTALALPAGAASLMLLRASLMMMTVAKPTEHTRGKSLLFFFCSRVVRCAAASLASKATKRQNVRGLTNERAPAASNYYSTAHDSAFYNKIKRSNHHQPSIVPYSRSALLPASLSS